MECHDCIEKIEMLADKVEQLEKTVRLFEDRNQIENLMSKYQYYYAAKMEKEILKELWSQQTKGIRVEERFFGIYEDFDGIFPDAGIKTYYATCLNAGSPQNYPGKMSVYATTTQMIEVAKDGKTAKGVWLAIGTETDAGEFAYDDVGEDPKVSGVQLSGISEDGKRFMADWVWQKYGVDFVKEDDMWKIWHLHIYDIFRCPFDENWVTYSEKRQQRDLALSVERSFSLYGKPTGRGTSFHWQYMTESEPVLEPKPPVPYEKFEDTFEY